MRPHGLDLFRSDCLPQRAQLAGQCRRIGSGGMNHAEQDLDHDGRIRQRPRRLLCDSSLPLGNLGTGRRRLGADVQVEPLHLGAADLACRHQVMERVVDAKPETIPELRVGATRRCLADQMHDRTAQGPVTGKQHARVRPETVGVERRDPLQRVIPARMAVAAEVSHSAEDPEDGPPGDAQRALQLIEPGNRTVAEEVLELPDIGVLRCVCHSCDQIYHIWS